MPKYQLNNDKYHNDNDQSTSCSPSSRRMFYSGDDVIYCDESLLNHSPYFSLIFEVVTGPIKIDRDFNLFAIVVRFAETPSLQNRLQLFEDSQISAVKDRLVDEFDFYAIIAAEDIRGMMGIPQQRIEKEQIITELQSHPKVTDFSGFDNLFGATIARTDIGPGEIHLILGVLVSQAWLYMNNMYQKFYGSWCAKKESVLWFREPYFVNRKYSDTFNSTRAHSRTSEHPPVSWLVLQMSPLLAAKRQMLLDIKRKLPNESFCTSGIDALFDGSARYTQNVDLILLMRAVVHHVSDIMKSHELLPKKTKINKIRRYLFNPCLTHMSKE